MVTGRNSFKSGGAVARVIFLLAILGAASVGYQKREELKALLADFRARQEGKQTRSASEDAAPGTSVGATTPKPDNAAPIPEPQRTVGKETEEPSKTEPEAAPTSSPVAVEEKPLDFDAVAGDPKLWPKQVALIKPVNFPLVFNGKVVGEAKVPAGTAIPVSRVIAASNGLQAGVEVVYQGVKRMLASDATDVIARATAVRKSAAESVSASVARTGNALPFSSQPRATVHLPAAPTPAAASSANAAQRISLEVIRQKRTRIEGGDWDDKKDRITLRVKLANSDSRQAFENYRGEVFVYAQSVLDPARTKLLGKHAFKFSLPVFGKHEVTTEEYVTAYDTTDVRFGHQYQGWIIQIYDAQGNMIIEKATNPTLAKSAEKLTHVGIGQEVAR